MEIKIRNFANISRLELLIQEGKLNFLYGISGSGKSSIAKALTLPKEEYGKYKTFGASGDVSVAASSELNFKIFDNHAIEEFVIAKSGAGVYDVLYGENKELKEIKGKLEEFLKRKDLIDIRNIISKQKFQIDHLEEKLGLKRTGTGGISKTGFFKTLSNSKDYVDENQNKDVKVKSWIKEGFSYVNDEVCPFCERKMTDKIVERIIKIVNELPKEYQLLIKAEDQLKQIGINIDISNINHITVQNELKAAIEKEYAILKDMAKIEDALSISIMDDKSLEKKVNIKIGEEVKKIFNDAQINIVKILDQLKMDKEGYTILKKKYNSILKSVIKGNINEINRYIDYFGIKYIFTKTDILSHDIGYSLVHKNAEKDTSEFLSTGEQNVISLILFLISYKEYDIIIDDPASSYDEYRREQILKFIFKIMYKKTSVPKTTLILSHDQIFLKFLSNYMDDCNYRDWIGEVNHIENINGNNRIVKISGEDMDTIMNHILKQCKNSMSYIQRVINLRMLYEIKNSNSIIYQYLSAVLHSKRKNITRDEMNKLLAEKCTSEIEVLKQIKKECDVELECFDSENYSVKMEQLSKFEQLCIIREEVNSDEKSELNNIIHFNYAMQHLLNPYKFNFQSEKSYLILDGYINKQTNQIR